MIRIFTIYFEGKYEPKYVTNLYRGLKKYCKVPFEFVCLTDNMSVEADRKIPISSISSLFSRYGRGVPYVIYMATVCSRNQ